MKLINGHPACVYGKEYAESTLNSMKKSELIGLLRVAQHNYNGLLQSYSNVQKYAEKLQKWQTSNWTPIEEETTDEEVLYCNKAGHYMIGFMEKDKESETGYKALCGGYAMPDVVAWQPLPLPYKKEK